MALTFNTPLTLPQGITVENAYGRVAAADGQKGDSISAGLDIYVSEAAFLSGAEPLQLPNLSFTQAPYNRETDGADILNIAHDMFVSELAKVGISATKNL